MWNFHNLTTPMYLSENNAYNLVYITYVYEKYYLNQECSWWKMICNLPDPFWLTVLAKLYSTIGFFLNNTYNLIDSIYTYLHK